MEDLKGFKKLFDKQCGGQLLGGGSRRWSTRQFKAVGSPGFSCQVVL